MSIRGFLSALALLCSLTVIAVEHPLVVRQFNVEDGLSQSTVYDIFQDSQGFIWLATENGINRYDGYEFKKFVADDGAGALMGALSSSIAEDVFKKVWIGSFEGIYIYDPASAAFEHLGDEDGDSGLRSKLVSDILKHSNGVMWVATYDGLHHYSYEDKRFSAHKIPPEVMEDADQLVRLAEAPDGKLILATQSKGVLSYDPQSRIFEVLFESNSKDRALENEIRDVYFDRRGILWIGTNGGLFRYDYKNKQLLDDVFAELKLSNLQRERVRSIVEDEQGQIWVSIYGAGILSLNPVSYQYRFYGYFPAIRYGLSGDTLDKLMFDSSGILWIGTEGYGVNIWDPVGKAFEHMIHRPDDDNSISNNVIWAMERDWQGNLWLGTEQGFNKISSDGKTITRYTRFGDAPNFPSSDLIYNIIADEQNGALWLATNKGLNRFDLATQTFEVYRHYPDDPKSLSNDIIYDLVMDQHHQLWIATPSGLDRMDLDSFEIFHYPHDKSDPHSIGENTSINKLYIDPKGTLWVGTDNGVNRYHRQQDNFDRFLYSESKVSSRELSVISSIVEVSPNVLWVAYTGEGIKVLDFANDGSDKQLDPKVSELTIKDGLPTNLVFGLAPDGLSRVWISTMNGFMLYDLKQDHHRFFGAKEGLLSSEFNEGAYYIDKSGKLYFGSTNGLAIVSPALIEQSKPKARLNFIDVTAYVGSQGVSSAVWQKSKVAIPYEAHAVKLQYTDFNYYASRPSEFAYRLDANDSKWISNGNSNTLTLNNLSVGEHELSLKRRDSGGQWSEAKTLTIEIIPPWYRTFGAYVVYAVMLCVITFLLVRAQGRKILRERSINMRLKRIDRLKDEFLANTSHELRTPLNGMIGLAESLLDGAAGELPAKAKHNLAMVVASGRRLANLVNDILDFSKLKEQNLELDKKAVDMHGLVDVVLTLSEPMTVGKGVKLVNDVSLDLPPAHGDEDRLQQVLLNLVSNGIKFSESGEVRVSAEVKGEQLKISVSDNGIGIDPKKLKTLFSSFDNADGKGRRTSGGAGLGLAVSQRLIELHGGQIKVRSQPGQGAVFSFKLPCSSETVSVKAPDVKPNNAIALMSEPSDYEEVDSHAPEIDCFRFRILLVDDEPVNRRVLHNYLRVYNYQVIEAASGEEALRAMEMNGPFDLILLDIMMPRMSGFEVCERLRAKYPVNDLAIIFLTANNQVADMVRSFAVGANDYLRKPVVKHELLSRVEMHLRMLDINRNLERNVIERTQELELSNKSITALSAICAEISSVLDMNELLLVVYEHIKNLMNVDVFCIGLYDEARRCIDFKLAIENDEFLPQSTQSLDEDGRPAVWCVVNRKPMITNDFVKDYVNYFGFDQLVPAKVGKDAASLMYWPLMAGDKIIGVLTVQSYQTDAYSEYQQETIKTLASTTAIALDNAKAYREVEQKNHEIIAAQEQLVQAEKMVSLGSLTAGVAHEINNPTNFVHVSAQNLEVDLSRFEQFIYELAGDDADEEVLGSFKEQFAALYEHLTTIKDGTERIKLIVQDLRAFTQLDVLDPKTVDITDCLQSTLNLVQTQYLDVAEFITDFQEHPQLLCHPAQLNQVFMNLIVNACDAIREKQAKTHDKTPGTVHVGCQVEGQNVVITVKDNGAGMSEETRHRLFEPFYTTKQVGEGTGLGLSISFGIVNKHNGELKVESQLGEGSVFTLSLPMQ